MSVLLRGVATEIVLVNRTRSRAKGVITDMRYGAPLVSPARLSDGDYPDLAGCDVVMITSGVNEKGGGATDRNDAEGRLRLLDKNVDAYRKIIPQVVRAAPDALLLVVTDPPDPLADLTRVLAQHDRVLSTGTYLDSFRFRVHVARELDVSPLAVAALVLGEHGKSEVLVWSGIRVGDLPLQNVLRERGIDERPFKENVERQVRDANIAIIEGNDASQYGIGIVSARIAEIVARNEREVIPVGSYVERYGVTLSLPALIAREGAVERFEPQLSDAERAGLDRSADVLRKALQRAGIEPRSPASV